MKITTLLLIAGIVNMWANNSYCQSAKVTLNLKNATIEQVLNEIESKSEFYFLFNQKLVDVNRKVDIVAQNKSIKDVLASVFYNQNVDYLVVDRQIILAPKDNLKSIGEFQQQKISGIITDVTTKEPIPGVNILVEGTSYGVISDINGSYTVSVGSPDAVLVFSYVGYVSQKVSVQGKSLVNIALSADVKNLEEIVVVGYGTTIKSNLTTSISKVTPDDIPSSANNTVNQLLFGRAAGLQVTQRSAEPGGTIDLSIRGRGNPLIIIDGIVVPNTELEPGSGQSELQSVRRGGLADINPADIESFEILKDASASIYGVAASNGVVLITTKKGKAGKMNVSYDGSRSVVTNMKYLEPLSGKDYMTYYNQFSKDEYLFNNSMVPFGTAAASGFVPEFSAVEIANATNKTDWLDEVLRTGSIDNHTLSMNGGNEKFTYYLSGNYFNQEGTLKKSGLTRYTTKMNITVNLTKYLKLNSSLGYSRNKYLNSTAGWQTGGSGTQGFGALQAAVSYPRYLPIRDEDGNYTLFGVTGNPVSLLTISDNTISSSIMGNFSLDLDIIPNMLTAKILYGNNYETAERNFYIPSDVFWNQIYESRATIGSNKRQNQTMEGILSFKKDFNKIINVDAILGMGQYISDDNGSEIIASNILDAINVNSIGAAQDINSISSYKDYEKRRSYFARTNFSIFDRYLVSLVYRLDGIDKFFPANKFAGFPSASVGWKISKEPFMQNLGFIDLIKIRASMGVTGMPIGSAAYGVYEPDAYQMYFDNGNTVVTPYSQTQIDQADLKWQKTVNTNIGLDFGFFRNRITGSVDYFRDKITNLLTTRATNQLSYIPTAYLNDGAEVRTGYELSLQTTNVVTTNFQWETLVNISHYLFRWDKRYANQDLELYEKTKDPVNSVYVYETSGILQIGETVPSYQPAAAQMPGAPKFVDRNGDDTISYMDVARYNKDPKLILGFGNNFRYKNLDLNVFFYAQLGAKDFNYALQWADPNGLAGGTMGATIQIKDAWSTANTSGKYPGIAYDETTLGLPTSVDTKLSSKDFVRCRNITLGYTFKSGEKASKYFRKLRVYFDVQNPFIITDYIGIDPEVTVGSPKGAAAPYPMARTYSLGVNVNF